MQSKTVETRQQRHTRHMREQGYRQLVVWVPEKLLECIDGLKAVYGNRSEVITRSVDCLVREVKRKK